MRNFRKTNGQKSFAICGAADPFQNFITTHPSSTARSCITDPSLLDFDMHQTGHGSVPSIESAMALEGWRTEPVMPVISGESEYEALEIPDPLPAAASRQAFWVNAINAGFAGHTYGANGIWQINRRNKPYGNSPGGNNWGTTPWDVAMHLPGSTQVGLAKKLIQSLPGWNTFEPKPEWIVSWSGKDTALFACAGMMSAIAYLLSPGTIQLRLPIPDRKYTACWFDPVTGKQLRDFYNCYRSYRIDYCNLAVGVSRIGRLRLE